MITDAAFYLVAVPAVILLGLAKGGFSGVGMLSLPMLLFVIDPIRAAAILLPILLVQDVVGVTAFRHSIDWRVIAAMLPGAVAGIALGYVYAANVSAPAVMAAVGAVSILFGVYRLWIERRGMPQPRHLPGWSGQLFGVASGFTSQIAHAGAPPFQIWVMPRRMTRDVLIGTTAFFFFAVNWIKVPAYVALGQFTRANLLTALALIPLAIGSTLAGVRLVRRISPERFYTAIYALMILVGAKLLWNGAA